MKKYKVLEAHQGDRFYTPGDGETGTRIADENAVGHLVTLGLLEEIGDVVVDEPAMGGAGASVGDLQAQIAALTQERDNALVDLAALGSTHQAAQDAASAVRDQFDAVTTDRDALRDQLTTVTSERDAHASRITALEGELASKTGNGQRPARKP